VGEVEVLDQLLVRSGFLEGVQVLAVKVLDKRLLKARDVGRGTHDRRHRQQAGALGRSPTPLAGDQLVIPLLRRTDENRLEYAQLAN